MKQAIFLILKRFFFGTGHDRSVTTMIAISMLALMLSSFCLALVASIMQGFEVATSRKLQGIHAALIIRAPEGQTLNTTILANVLAAEFPEIVSWSPSSTNQALVQVESGDNGALVIVKAIDPEREITTTALADYVHAPADLAHTIFKNRVLIGKRLADENNFKLGDPITLWFTDNQHIQSQTLSLHQQTAHIAGWISTGIEELDSALIICSFEFFLQVWPEHGVDTLALTLKSGTDEHRLIESLRSRLGLEVRSWKELYPALVSALKLEKWGMYLILSLMALLATMNLIALMYMMVAHKQKDIAVLKALGMSTSAITTLFMLYALIITSVATALGLMAAYLVGKLMVLYPVLTLPDTYYVSTIPVELNGGSFLMIAVCMLIIAALACLLPLAGVRTISIPSLLKMNG